MMEDEKRVVWYDNPNTVTNILIGLIGVIIILSQSFAINSNLSAIDIFNSIVNHNSMYLIALVYFVALTTYTGKKYFNFLNLFLICFYAINSVTSLLTVFQTFSLFTILSLVLNVVILIYIVHTFLRGTRYWQEYKVEGSPFNDISNQAYYTSIVGLAISVLALDLIFASSPQGMVLSILDCFYIILFGRYIYLYGCFINSKKTKKSKKGAK